MATIDRRLQSSSAAPARYRLVILAVVVGGQVLIAALYLTWGALTPFLRDEFGLTRTQIGMLVGATAAGSMIASTPFGRIGDRVGVRRMITGGFAALALIAVVIGLTESFLPLLASIFAVGLAYGAVNPNGIKALVSWFPRHEMGTAVALKQAGYPLGGALAAASLPVLTLALGSWRLPLIGLGLLIGVVAVAAYKLVRENPGHGPKASEPIGAWWTLLLRRDVILLSLVGTLYAAVQGAWLGYLVLFSQEHLQLPITVGAGFLALSQLSSVAGCLLLGFVSDRLFGGRRRELLAACGFVAAAVLLAASLMAGAPLWLLGVLAVGYGLSAGSWPPLRLAALATFGGARSSGMLVGLGLATGSLGNTFGPPLFGRAVDTIGAYGPAWQGAAVVAVVGALLTLVVREPKRAGEGEGQGES